MILVFNYTNALVSFSAFIALFSALSILIVPSLSFADRIVVIRQYTTFAVGCDLASGDDFIGTGTTKILTYDKSTKLIFNCERSGGDVDLKKGESVSVRCLHDNPLTNLKQVKMKSGELFYVLCNAKHKL